MAKSYPWKLNPNNQLEWWGYLTTCGGIQTRRYFGDPGDILEAEESDFVEHIVRPFYSDSKESAKKSIEIDVVKYLQSLK